MRGAFLVICRQLTRGTPRKIQKFKTENLGNRCDTTDSIPGGYSSAGRALEWHSRGQRFDPAYLHQSNHVAKASWFELFKKNRGSGYLCKKAQSVLAKVCPEPFCVSLGWCCLFTAALCPFGPFVAEWHRQGGGNRQTEGEPKWERPG